MSNFFEAPAYKLDIRDLSNARETNGDGNWTLLLKSESLLSGGSLRDNIPSKEITLALNIIWIQGTVLDIVVGDENSPSTLHLWDLTGEAFLHEYSILPGGDHPQITKGAYVGVIGQIWSIDPIVVIKGAKVMCLEGKPALQEMWRHEVIMSKAFLLGLLTPELTS